MKQLIILIFILLVSICSYSQKYVNKHKLSTNDTTVMGKTKCPHKFKYEGNPLSRMHSADDPDVHVGMELFGCIAVRTDLLIIGD